MTGLLLYVFCEFASFGNVGLIRFMRVLKTSFTHVARGVHLEPPRVAVQCASLRLWMQAVRLRDVRGRLRGRSQGLAKGEKDSTVCIA